MSTNEGTFEAMDEVVGQFYDAAAKFIESAQK